MNRTKRHLLVVAVLIALLTIPTFVVFAKELGSLTISGPGINGEMSINHPGGMMKLEQSGFFDQSSAVKPPDNLGAGYKITAFLNLDGKAVPFVQMVYYPTDSGQPGYVHYTARLNGESLRQVDEWGKLNKDADTAFLGLMAEYNITLQPAIVSAPAAANGVPNAEAQPGQAPAKSAEQTTSQQPSSAPSISSIPTSYIISAVVATILLLAGAGLALRRRAISHPTT
jgi:hypothetical protein